MDKKMTTCQTIGYWMSKKKWQKMNMHELEGVCKKFGYDIIRLDIEKPLEEQGPFCAIFHKLTEIILQANCGDNKAQENMKELERYFSAHPELPIIDPLDRVRRILDRYQCYLALKDNPQLTAANVFTPVSVELTSTDPAVNLSVLQKAGVSFPIVCKPSVSHGSTAHEMVIIFNEAAISDCRPPVIAQTFINHNAVVYKVYCVGNEYVTVNRPSIKNFYEFSEQKTIFFSSDVSKPDATSSLTVLDENDPSRLKPTGTPDPTRIKTIVDAVQSEIGLKFLGIDVVIENDTNRYAIIDLNSYPGYDGFPNFFESAMRCIVNTMKEHADRVKTTSSPCREKGKLGRLEQEDSGFDTSDSSHSQ